MELEFSDPLFCVAFHPSEPQFVVGFVSGRVECHSYNRSEPKDTEIVWQTRRHKGSTRCLAYSQDGSKVLSGGSDCVVKQCDSQTGKVVKKVTVPSAPTSMCLNEAYVCIGDEDGKVHIYTLDLELHRKYNLPNIECVSAVCALPQNKHSFACSGDMFVCKLDARKPDVSSVSEDQEDDILSGCVCSETRSAWGLSEGVVTVWNNRGLEDQQHRIKLTKNGSVDALLAGEVDDHCVAGTSDNLVCLCDLVSGQCLASAPHNKKEEDEVVCLDYDCDYRLVSCSMTLLRMWSDGELESEARSKKKKKKKQVKANAKKEPMFADL